MKTWLISVGLGNSGKWSPIRLRMWALTVEGRSRAGREDHIQQLCDHDVFSGVGLVDLAGNSRTREIVEAQRSATNLYSLRHRLSFVLT